MAENAVDFRAIYDRGADGTRILILVKEERIPIPGATDIASAVSAAAASQSAFDSFMAGLGGARAAAYANDFAAPEKSEIRKAINRDMS